VFPPFTFILLFLFILFIFLDVLGLDFPITDLLSGSAFSSSTGLLRLLFFAFCYGLVSSHASNESLLLLDPLFVDGLSPCSSGTSFTLSLSY
jgi:hypothetical protein